MTPLHHQIRRAVRSQGVTLADLLRRADLEMSIVSISRKLNGKQIMTTAECEALAAALGIKVSAGVRRRAA